MKRIFCCFSLTLILFTAFAQDTIPRPKLEIDAFYNWSMVGKSISLLVNKPLGRHVISAGLKYHDNHIITDKQNYVYKNRFREDGTREALGLNIGYRFDLCRKNQIVNPYLFYLLQVSYLRNIENYAYAPYSGALAGQVLLKVSNPFYIFEHTIGIGLQTRLFRHFYLNQSVGIGWAHFKPHDSFQTVGDPVTLLRIGATYKIEQ